MAYHKLFLVPCGAPATKKNFEKTVLTPVKQSVIFPTLPRDARWELRGRFFRMDIPIWGSANSPSNRRMFAKMRENDHVIFAARKRVKLVGEIAFKTVNAKLSRILWPEGERIFKLVFFLKKIALVDQPVSKVYKALGYSERFVLRGLTAVSDQRLEVFEKKYGNPYCLLEADAPFPYIVGCLHCGGEWQCLAGKDLGRSILGFFRCLHCGADEQIKVEKSQFSKTQLAQMERL